MSARWVFEQLSPAGARARLSVLIFHRVLPAPDPLFPGEVDAARFETQMRWVKQWFNVLPLTEAVALLRSGRLPARAAAITFDDGYADNCTIAMPILQRAGLRATFFIATGYLDGGRMWNDTVIDSVRRAAAPALDLSALNLGRFAVATLEERRHSVGELVGKLKYLDPLQRERLANDIAVAARVEPPQDLMLTTAQVRAMAAAGMTIGAHTVSHPILARVADDDAKREMTQSKQQLEAITGGEVSLFAYPNGKPGTDYLTTHARLAREAGFAAAVSTGWGAARQGCDLFQMPRFTPWDRSQWRYALRLARNLRHAASVA
jgi:peptidoglycan/xylan/chitin deacetylase (PgdA/CDA1 family)